MAPSKAAAPFTKDERVLCFHLDMLYEAKVLDARPGDEPSTWEYKIHYKGWKNTVSQSHFTSLRRHDLPGPSFQSLNGQESCYPVTSILEKKSAVCLPAFCPFVFRLSVCNAWQQQQTSISFLSCQPFETMDSHLHISKNLPNHMTQQWDDWVPQDRVRKFTDENKELAAQLQNQMKVLQQKAPKSGKKKGGANGSDFSSARGSEERTTSAAAQSGRGGQRRARDYENENVSISFPYCPSICVIWETKVGFLTGTEFASPRGFRHWTIHLLTTRTFWFSEFKYFLADHCFDFINPQVSLSSTLATP
jgi:hypothetical protein